MINNNKEEYIIVKIFKGKIMGNTGHVYPNKEIAEMNRNNYQNGIEKPPELPLRGFSFAASQWKQFAHFLPIGIIAYAIFLCNIHFCTDTADQMV